MSTLKSTTEDVKALIAVVLDEIDLAIKEKSVERVQSGMLDIKALNRLLAGADQVHVCISDFEVRHRAVCDLCKTAFASDSARLSRADGTVICANCTQLSAEQKAFPQTRPQP